MRGFFVASLALLALACAPASALAEGPVRLSAELGSGARLGGHAPLRFDLQIDQRRLRRPITDIRLLAPAGIGIGGLGLATCRAPEAVLVSVLRPSPPGVVCPRNAIIGRGTATAALIFDPAARPITSGAEITLYSGEAQDDRPGLLVVAQTSNPVTTQLAYAGRLSPARRPFGLEFALQIRAPASPPFGAEIALTRMRATLGGRDLFYTRSVAGKRTFYRPGGVGLPDRCPRGGLPVRAELRFSDGSERAVEAQIRCPARSR